MAMVTTMGNRARGMEISDRRHAIALSCGESHLALDTRKVVWGNCRMEVVALLVATAAVLVPFYAVGRWLQKKGTNMERNRRGGSR
jgi:hypothetical protein